MPQTSGSLWKVIVVLTILAGGGVLAYTLLARHTPKAPPPAPPTAKKAIPATSPGTPEAPKIVQTASYLDVIRDHYRDFPTTRPLGFPLDLSEAAHVVLTEPVFVGSGPRQDLWITRPDAPPTADVLRDAIDPNLDAEVHVLRERVAYVHWQPVDHGIWPPYLICPTSDGEYECVSQLKRQKLPHRDYQWQHAFSWNEKLIVPCSGGVSILTFEPKFSESFHSLTPPDVTDLSTLATPRVLLDWQGLLAWIPWEDGKTGGRGASRFLEDKWTDLTPEAGWPEKILHLVPLSDGNVLILSVPDSKTIQLSLMVLDKIHIDVQQITPLVDQLADPDAKKRDAAFKKLTTFGPGIWPILEKMIPDQGPEVQSRLRLLLKDKQQPTLAGMKLLGRRSFRLVTRLSDGGTVFYAESGVMLPNPDLEADPTIVAPAWISIRPGEPIELLPSPMVSELNPRTAKIDVIGSDWIINSDARGPRRFIGNGFVNLVRRAEAQAGFINFVGQDRRGRWVFAKARRHQEPSTLPATQQTPATSSSDEETVHQTLIIDPTLPDPTPRLPVWEFKTAKTVGWDKDGWPVAKDVSAYALHEDGWRLLGENDKIFTDVAEMATTQPSTLPATGPTTTQSATLPATQPEAPLLVDIQGNRYFGGLTDLRRVSPAGVQTTWPLPPAANGPGPATLLGTADGKVFLFNQPGRVLRIKPTPDGPEPFKLEATFTRKIPNVETPTRIWLDPGGRIIVAWESQLAIMFPGGYIPPILAEKMLTDTDDDEQ